ncbi:hypothetical protein ANANG_G00115990 [Anguilla anguilla]|uniref:Uncharacterized protein n=1 Tax=Anguilla anguilla TaxID=7936 RepID=A0A9D3MED3_ANGAN|nr:hypothetical protein ANANG_G00115990 [Anguilla anguilla]
MAGWVIGSRSGGSMRNWGAGMRESFWASARAAPTAVRLDLHGAEAWLPFNTLILLCNEEELQHTYEVTET